MLNPNKYIRKAIIDSFPQYKIWANLVPKDVTTPNIYGLITSMSKNEIVVSKTCYEWNVGFNLDLFKKNNLGFDGITDLDNMAEIIIPAMKELTSDTILIKNVTLESENDIVQDTGTNTINRKVLLYSVWCAYTEFRDIEYLTTDLGTYITDELNNKIQVIKNI